MRGRPNFLKKKCPDDGIFGEIRDLDCDSTDTYLSRHSMRAESSIQVPPIQNILDLPACLIFPFTFMFASLSIRSRQKESKHNRKRA